MEARAQQQTEPLPKPFGWRHPEKTWSDILLTWLFRWFVNLAKLARFAPTKESSETVEGIQKFRASFDKMKMMGIKRFIRKWSKAVGSDIVDVKLSIPHRADILKQWGIVTGPADEKLLSLETYPADGTPVNVFFPASLLKGSPAMSDAKIDTATGCIPLTQDEINLTELCNDDNVHVMLYFHGGAMVLGDGYDPDIFDYMTKLVEMGDSDKKMQFVLLSVDYKLAPEVPFPVAPMEVLTVMDHLLEEILPKQKKLHVSGISAGAYLATVASMEYIRKSGPERLGSVCILAPFVDPAADSLSYFQNSTDAYNIVPASFLRWSWQCYLELPPAPPVEKKAETLDELLGQNSNRIAWNQCQWKNSVFERLVKPAVDLPTNVGGDLKIIVMTNRADALHDEGIELIEKLRQVGAANLEHVDAGGSHFFGLGFEPKTERAMISVWRDAIIA